MYSEGFGQLLRRLASARIALQAANDTLKAEQALAETRAHEAHREHGTLGKNADERERQMLVALDSDQRFRRVRDLQREHQASVWNLESELQILTEQRRDRELQVRERLLALAEQGRLPTAL